MRKIGNYFHLNFVYINTVKAQKLIFFIFLFLGFLGHTQEKEASFWYFGRFSGIHFNLDPTSLIDGRADTEEGSSVATDASGNLLFYTNGVNVWTAAQYPHPLMQNGTGLLGGNNSSQSALIIPRPGHPDIFYIFTVSGHQQFTLTSSRGEGLNYSTVDMSRNGGAGAVINKNIPLSTYNAAVTVENDLKCSQKLTAVQHADDESFWVVTHFLHTFYAFRVTARGVVERPVKSKIGPTLYPGNYALNSKGQMKISPDGTKLAMANEANGIDSQSEGTGNLYLFDFNDTTGEVSNPVELLPNDFIHPYGVEFSDNSKKLYATLRSWNDRTINRGQSSLYQFDLSSGQTPPRAFRMDIDLNFPPGALQLAIDRKIYRAMRGRPELSVINTPREDRTNADYQSRVINLLGRISKTGLPSFIQSYFHVEIKTQNTCVGRETELSINYLPEPVTIDWDFGDGNRISGTSDKRPRHVYNTPGDYTVTATITKGTETEIYQKTITIYPLPVLNATSLTQCDDDGDGFSDFNLKEAQLFITSEPGVRFTYHFTLTDAETGQNPINQGVTFSDALASRLYVRATGRTNCHNTTTLELNTVNTSIPNNFQLFYSACDDMEDGDDTNGITAFDLSDASAQIQALFPADPGLLITYYKNRRDALAELNAIDPSNHRNVDSPFQQDIWVRIENPSGNACFGLGNHIQLQVDPTPVFEVSAPPIFCINAPETINLRVLNAAENYQYEWKNATGEVLSTDANHLDVNDFGTYYVTATKTDGTGCSKTKSFEIVPSVIANIQNITVIDNSSNNSITLSVNGIGDYEFALNDNRFVSGNQDNGHQFTGVPLGEHTVYIRDKNGCGMVQREVSLIGFPRFFTPNGDSVNDTWQIIGVRLQPGSKITIFDRYGKLLADIDPTSTGWDGTFNGNVMPSSDYWFSARLQDGRIYKGHFSLKR